MGDCRSEPPWAPLYTVARPRLILAAFGLAAAAACRCGGEEATGPPPPLVQVAAAATADVPELFQTIGTVESIQTVRIRARVGGQLLSVEFEPGSVVQQGQLLLQLDPRPFEQALDAAEARLVEARTQARQLGADARRYQELERRGAVATQQAEQTMAAARAAAANVEAATAGVEQARIDLEFTTIEAPVTGRSGDLSVRIGDQIEPNSAEPLLTIQVMDPIRVRFTLPADRLPAVLEAAREGEVEVRAGPRDNPEAIRMGVLDFIDNAVDEASGTILLKAIYDNTEEIFWPGEPTDVWLLVRTLEGVVVVPTAAVQIGPEGTFVFVVRPESSTVEMRPIRPGPAHEGRTAVIEGVNAGERVVVSGQLRLRPGMEVRITGEEAPPAEEAPAPEQAPPSERAPTDEEAVPDAPAKLESPPAGSVP